MAKKKTKTIKVGKETIKVAKKQKTPPSDFFKDLNIEGDLKIKTPKEEFLERLKNSKAEDWTVTADFMKYLKKVEEQEELSRAINEGTRYLVIPQYWLPAEELKKEQKAIIVSKDSLNNVKEFLNKATNAGEPLKYEILEEEEIILKNGKKQRKPLDPPVIITHLWGGEQRTPIDESYCFLTNAGDTYPIRKKEFDETYEIINEADSNSVMTTKKQQKIIRAVPITVDQEENIVTLLKYSSFDKSKYKDAGHIDKTTNPWTLVINTLEGVQKIPFTEPKKEGNKATYTPETCVLIQGVNNEVYHNKYKKFSSTYVQATEFEIMNYRVKKQQKEKMDERKKHTYRGRWF